MTPISRTAVFSILTITAFSLLTEQVQAQRKVADRNVPVVEILVGRNVVSHLPSQYQLGPRESGHFVLPEYGTEYQIRLSSLSKHSQAKFGDRCLFDIDVDGLSVMTGRPSLGGPSGYVVESGRSNIISGWKVDFDTDVDSMVEFNFAYSVTPNSSAVKKAFVAPLLQPIKIRRHDLTLSEFEDGLSGCPTMN